MTFKYQNLQSSWGIVIFITMDVDLSYTSKHDDLKITDKISFRLDGKFRLKNETILFWANKVLSDLKGYIESAESANKVCFLLKSLDFIFSDFQEEGLYCAIKEWISNYYNLDLPVTYSYFDSTSNRYIFPSLS